MNSVKQKIDEEQLDLKEMFGDRNKVRGNRLINLCRAKKYISI